MLVHIFIKYQKKQQSVFYKQQFLSVKQKTSRKAAAAIIYHSLTR